MSAHIRPDLNDALSAPMWAALRKQRLILQYCTQCSYTIFPAAEMCPECWSREVTWREVVTVGTIWSYTTYERALHAELESAVPYTVAFIELNDGPIIPGRIHANHSEIKIGARVNGCFTDTGDEFTMLEWEIADLTPPEM